MRMKKKIWSTAVAAFGLAMAVTACGRITLM